jgi:hypothetical protein
MKIKIISAQLPTFWYASHIGEIFDAEPIRNGFLLKEHQTEHIFQVVEAEDCEIIKEN